MDKAILVNLATTKKEKEEARDSMAELAGLAAAGGARVVGTVFQNRPRASVRSFLGKGKVEEVHELRKQLGADLVIFDHNLTPTQQRSLENEIGAKVIDRTQLILEIFGQRARTNEGKLQVEMAQLSYLLPRLVGKGIAMSRLGAGIRTRGPGEKKLEEERRRINDRIAKVRKDILAIQKRRAGQRESRRKSPVPTVSLVGYTSAGKSTLFNTLTRERRYTSPNLFATLDPVLRRVSYPDGLYFFLSDTVGFIRKLPAELVTSFQATLDEVREADAVCHIIDATSPRSREQAAAVDGVLAKIGVTDVPVVRVFNKIDLLAETERADLLRRNTAPEARTLYLSALTGEGTGDLMGRIREILFRDYRPFTFRIPADREDLARSLPQRSLVLKRRERDGALEFQVMADPEVVASYLPYLRQGEDPW
ncbi:MAG TPA: GTPase HflX [Acidobacteriota bacterium]|nr:GTPase HflX [Acidobacteriota bacterium]